LAGAYTTCLAVDTIFQLRVSAFDGTGVTQGWRPGR
jgi:hypothetical protein